MDWALSTDSGMADPQSVDRRICGLWIARSTDCGSADLRSVDVVGFCTYTKRITFQSIILY